MFEQSESIAALAAAMALAQGSVEGATKGRVNPAFKSKYADLASVWEACREALCTNDLTVVQFPGEMVDNRLTLTTQLSHKSGEWMRATLSIPLSKVDAQGYGSAVTYARRYALAAVVGVCPEDDDGAAASRPAAARPQLVSREEPPAQSDDTKRQPLKGPIKTRAEIRTKCGEFVRDLHACGDADMLEALLSDSKALIDQVRDEVEFYWLGDGQDFKGMKREIELAQIGFDDSWKSDPLRAG